MTRTGSLGRWLPILVLLALSIGSVWPLLCTGDWYVSKQSYRYPYLLELFKASVLSGHLYPRWLPELFGGYGYPTFVYYPPGFWYFALPAAIALPDVIHAMYVAMIAAFWLGGIGAYQLSRWTLDRGAALFCAVCFLASPYLSVQLYRRGSLAELIAALLCPWVFFSLLRLKQALADGRAITGAAVVFALALAASIFCHIMIAFWLAVAAVVILAVLLLRRDWPRGLLPVLVVCGILALALASPYWYPALSLREAVMFRRALWLGNPIPLQEFVALQPNRTGLLPTLLAVAGFWLDRRRKLTQAVALATALLVALMSTGATWLWQSSRLLRMTQHPGRIYAVLITLALFGFIGCAAHWSRLRFAPRLLAAAAVLTAATLWFGTWALQRPRPLDYARFRLQAETSFEDMTHNHELQPKGSRSMGLVPRLRPSLPVADAEGGARLEIRSLRGDDLMVRATVVAPPADITLNQLAFPGWRITVNGRAVDRCGGRRADCWRPDRNGRMRIQLARAGRFDLRAWFDGPPNAGARNAVALIVVAAGIGWLRWRDRRRPGEPRARVLRDTRGS